MRLLLSIILLLSAGLLSATAADSLGIQDKTVEVAGSAFQQFSQLMNWFVYALILISVISLIRMFLVKRRINNKGDNPNQANPDPNQPKLRRQPISWPLVIVLILITIIIYQTLNRTNEQITKESFSNFMARVRAEQITQVQFAEKDLFYADLANKKYLTTLPFESPQLVDSLVSLGIKVSATRPHAG